MIIFTILSFLFIIKKKNKKNLIIFFLLFFNKKKLIFQLINLIYKEFYKIY
jgi:heme/copper-type cytochrome/quinol oxidase subunit 4